MEAPVWTALRVFGCACYPYLRPYSQNKFDPKSLMCVFLGYNEKYKGYRCYHLLTGRVYINCHVLFDEDRLPYKDTYQHLVPAATTPLSSAWRLQSKPITSSTHVSTDGSVSDKENEECQLISWDTLSSLPQEYQKPYTTLRLIIHSLQNQVPQRQVRILNTLILIHHQDLHLCKFSNLQNQDNAHRMMTRAKAGIMKSNPRYVCLLSKYTWDSENGQGGFTPSMLEWRNERRDG